MTESEERELVAILMEYVEKYGLTPRARDFFAQNAAPDIEQPQN